MQLSAFIIIIFSFFFVQSNCDLPVHCLARDIAGTWQFKMEIGTTQTQKACGHLLPDRNTDHLRETMSLDSDPQVMEVNLVLPDIVRDSNGKDIGNWTMVYDEGFSVEFSSFSFFAFSKYIVTHGINPQDTDDEQSTGYLSQCGETFKGWYKMNNKWGCFFGMKKGEVDGMGKYTDPSVIFKGNQGPKIVQRENLTTENSSNMSLFDRFQNNLKLYDMPHDDFMKENMTKDNDMFEPDFSFIQLVNDLTSKLPWKAKNTESFREKTKGQMKKLIGMTRFKQVKLRLSGGIKEGASRPIPQLASSSDSFLQINFRSKLKLRKGAIHAPVRISNCEGTTVTGYPKCFDWRNSSGINFDTPVKSQGDCGSCYAEAVLSAVESRIRIKSNNQLRPILSITNMISCSRYNQGCNGGYPWLVGKHGKEFGFSEATCQANTEQDSFCDSTCLADEFASSAKSKGKLWMIKDFGYIGKKYYGSTSEAAMMEELYKNGPITIAFNAAPDLYYYSNGVFITNPKESFSQDNFRRDISPWEFTNHAVVCVGWGETEHEGQLLKYWIFKNSWGEDWGEGGYFRMLRGFDLGAVENQAVFVDPIV